MILIDLRFALFALLLLVIGCTIGLWVGLRRAIVQYRSPNKALAHIPDELPFGLLIVHQDGTILQANSIAQHLIAHSPGASTANQRSIPPFFIDLLQHTHTTSGFITQPNPLRWWRYTLSNQTAVLLLVDTGDYQRLVRRHQTFVGQMSHEIRTPLTAIIAHLEIMRNPQTDPELHDRSLVTVQREVHRLARLVRDLLELHRLETSTELPHQPTNIVLVVEDAITEIFPYAEANAIDITLEAISPIPSMLLQADRIKQVFLNLLDNAVKYCRPGDSINIQLNSQPNGVHCVIADNGPGIAAADLARVQEPLYRGRTDVEGSGIGLALVSEILRRHHAELSIESSTEPEHSGTKCSWILPYAVD